MQQYKDHIERAIEYWQLEYPKWGIPIKLQCKSGPVYWVMNSLIMDKGYSIPDAVHEVIGLEYGLLMDEIDQVNHFGYVQFPDF